MSALRVAWLGPAPNDESGVSYMATQVLRHLPAAGAEVDAYFAGTPDRVPSQLHDVDGLRVTPYDIGWRFDRWYSRTEITKLGTGLPARAIAQAQLARSIAREHARRPYDVVYQFSQPELLVTRALRSRLPPLVLHPETHAAAELLWIVAEAGRDSVQQRPAHRTFVRSMLRARAALQASDARLVERIIAPSRAFARAYGTDYAVAADRIGVVPNPIDLQRFSPADRKIPASDRELTVLFVGRIVARKGVDLVAELSHRIGDLRGQVRIEVHGGPSQWSDHRPVLGAANPGIVQYLGSSSTATLRERYRTADVLLQPSRYEPFALTVGEALASGTPVVVSDEVGAGEDLDEQVCRRFASGDAESLERQLRALVTDLRAGRGDELAAVARSEAERRFAPPRVARALADELRTAAAG